MPTTVEVSCPKCGGPLWDNRETKKNPKAPDFKCRDKTCDGVIWPPKPGQRPPVALAAKSNEKQAYSIGGPLPYEVEEPPYAPAETGAPPSALNRLDTLFATYDLCLTHAIQQSKKLHDADVGTTPEAVAAMAATLFIQATK
jgi:hypothetical protein